MIAPRRDPAAFVRPAVRALSAYHLDQVPCRFKLDQNECPWEPPHRLKRAVAAALAEAPWAQYPDFHGDELRRALGARWGWPFEGVLVGNGSNELLATALAALAGPGDEVLGMAPGFGLYPALAQRSGARFRALGPRHDLALPIYELEFEIEADPRRPVLICSPNNPTGQALSPEEVGRLAGELDAPLLLDAAYAEFCRYDYRPLLDEHPNLVMFRTFSKAWGLAGLRLGYLLARPELVAELIKVKLPYNVGRAAIAAGLAVLGAEPAMARRRRAVVARRAQWRRVLEAVRFEDDRIDGGRLEVLPSEANFLLVRCGGRAGRIRDGLARRGILVRDVSRGPGLAGCLRVTVGGGAALRAVERALAEIAAEAAGEEAR